MCYTRKFHTRGTFAKHKHILSFHWNFHITDRTIMGMKHYKKINAFSLPICLVRIMQNIYDSLNLVYCLYQHPKQPHSPKITGLSKHSPEKPLPFVVFLLMSPFLWSRSIGFVVVIFLMKKRVLLDICPLYGFQTIQFFEQSYEKEVINDSKWLYYQYPVSSWFKVN